MILTYLPSHYQHLIDFPLGNPNLRKVLAQIPDEKRVVVMECTWSGWREVIEITPDTLYMISEEGYQIYARLCWRKWGLYDHETQAV